MSHHPGATMCRIAYRGTMLSLRPRRGLTLIELLIVIVVIGILAAIAAPKFQRAKGLAYAAALKSDLKNVSSMQEEYFYSNEMYAGSVGALSFRGSEGAIVTIVESDGRGWSATATHPESVVHCQ